MPSYPRAMLSVASGTAGRGEWRELAGVEDGDGAVMFTARSDGRVVLADSALVRA